MTCPSNPVGGPGCGLWADPVVDGNGKIIIAGDFVSVDGVNAPCVARLSSNGTVDSTFNASGFVPAGFSGGGPRPIRGIVIQSDGKIVIGGRFNGSPNNRIALVRLNTDGSRDFSYAAINGNNLPPNGMIQIRGVLIQPDDKVIAIDRSVWRFNTDGSLDPTFNNVALLVQQQPDTDFASGEAFNIAGTADGGFLVGGIFTDIDDASGPPGPEYWGAAKLHADGTLDTSFNTSHREGLKIEPSSFARQTDGSVQIAFNSLGFDTLHPVIPHNLGRLTLSGTLDTSYDPLAALNTSGPLGANFLALGFTGLGDGSVLVTGQGGAHANYGHLLPDGTEDSSYNADPHTTFATAFPRPDGHVVLDGFYQNINTFFDPSAQNAANGAQVQRINANGLLDTSFSLDDSIRAATQQRDVNGNLTAVYVGSRVLAVTSDEKVIFGYFASDLQYHLVRLNSDGSIDTSFTAVTFPASYSIRPVAVNPPDYPQINSYRADDLPVKQGKAVLDNKVVLMGSFDHYGGTPAHGLLRVNSDGTVDTTFNIGGGAQWTQTPEIDPFHPSVDNLEVGLDDKLLLTGTFEAFNGIAAPGIISLNPDGTVDTSFVAPVKRQKFDYQSAYLARQNDGSFLLSGPYSRATDNISPSFFGLIFPPGAPTPTGNNVSVDEVSAGVASDVTTSFGNVTSTGTTSVSVIDPNWAGQLPSGYQIVGANLAFEVYTTSSYTGPITVCFTLSSLDDATFAIARLFHNDGNGLVDVTSSKDLSTKTICGTVSSLSPFVLLKPPYQARIQQPINANGSSVFTVKRGVVPVKFTLTLNGNSTCTLPPATIAVTRTGGGTIGTVNESVYSGSTDNGSNFRIDSCQYIYNLNSNALGAGTYRVEILINGQAVGSAIFQLK